jgi:outer membrane protein assembly factor BamB
VRPLLRHLTGTGAALAVLCALAVPAKAAGAAPVPTNALVMDSAQPPLTRLSAALQLHGTESLSEEAALRLVGDFLTLPDLPSSARVQAAEIAYQRARKNLIPVMAGFCAKPAQREAASAVTASMAPGFLKTVLMVLLEGGPSERRIEAATVILHLEFSHAAWAGLSVASDLDQMDKFSSLALSAAYEPDERIRAALARCMARTGGAWGAEAARKLRSDADAAVKAEMEHVPVAAAAPVAGAAPGSAGETRGGSTAASTPATERPTLWRAEKPPAPPPYSGKKKEVAAVEARFDLLRELTKQEWFRFSYATSPQYRARFEQLLGEAAGRGMRAVIARDTILCGVRLTVKAPDGAGVFLNGVFAGRTPVAVLQVRADAYRVTAHLAGKVASREVTLEDGDREVAFETADFSPAATAFSPLTAEAAEFGLPSWTLGIAGRRVDRLILADEGVVVAGEQDGPRMWYLERRAGHQRWEASLGLPPTCPPARLGGRLYWGAIDGFLHAVDLASGTTAMVLSLGGALELPPLPCGESLACAAWDRSDGGRVTLVDVEAEKARWSFRTPGRPVSMFSLDGGLALVTEEGGDGARITFLGAEDGRERWSRAVARRDGMVVAGAGAHLFLRDGDLTRPPAFLALASGEPRVLVEPEGGGEVVAGFVRGNRAALVTAKAQLYWVDPARRTILWHRPLPAWDGRAVRLFDAGTERIALIAGTARQTDGGEMRTGVFQTIAAATGRVLFSASLCMSDPPAELGQGRVLFVDPTGAFLVRDFRRSWTPLVVASGLAGSVGGLPSAGGDGVVYVASPSRKELLAFDLGPAAPVSPRAPRP